MTNEVAADEAWGRLASGQPEQRPRNGSGERASDEWLEEFCSGGLIELTPGGIRRDHLY